MQMNKLERVWIEDRRSAKRAWRFWWAATASATVAFVLMESDFVLIPLIVAIVFWFKTVSEMKRQLRLREEDSLVGRYAAWQLSGVFFPILWPLWRALNRLPEPPRHASQERSGSG